MIMTVMLALFAMIFCHIIDDYYLQGWLASAKQKEWWKNNAPDKLYKNDYIIALFMHSFSWSFMIMLVPTLLNISNLPVWYVFVFMANLGVHMIVDDLKANEKKINLVQDQIIHLVQIVITWIVMIVIL